MAKAVSILTRVKHLFGKKLSLSGYSNDLYYAALVEETGIYDEDLLLALRTAADILGGDTILDVGANIGYISCALATFNPTKQIHAFEPVASNVIVFEKNLKQNQIDNVTIHPYGLGSEEKSGFASWDPDNRGSAFITKGDHEKYPEQEEVVIRVLDKEYKKLEIKSCALIKVDIEGYELEFLRGGKGFLQAFKPTVVMEANNWCLNALQNITFPDFLNEILNTFPYVHAFWGNRVIDVREHTETFMHENIVNNRYMNLICSFDKTKHQKIIKKYKKVAEHLNFERYDAAHLVPELQLSVRSLQLTNQKLEQRVTSLAKENAMLEEGIYHLGHLNIRGSIKQLLKSVYRSIRFRVLRLIWGKDSSYQNMPELDAFAGRKVTNFDDAVRAINAIVETDKANIALVYRHAPVRNFIFETLRYGVVAMRRLYRLRGRANG